MEHDMNESIRTLIETGKSLVSSQQQVQVFPGSKVPYYMTLQGIKLCPELIFNDHADRPERIKANVQVLDVPSFVHYYQTFGDEESGVFADEVGLRVTAVLDYHQNIPDADGKARWGQHRVVLALRHSEEWLRWSGSNNKQMTQQQFAEFLEQNGMDITDPKPANIRDVAESLNATSEVEFGAGVRMNDGQVRFKYSETIKATVGAGQLAVPDRFTLTIPAFIGGERVDLGALLRFRVKEGKLTFWYTLVRPEEVVRKAFAGARDQVAKALEITIINGSLQA